MPRRPRYPLELTATLAFGLATAWWCAQRSWAMSFRERVDLGRYVQQHVDPFLSGVALAGGIGLWGECWRRRSPSAWGVGRWTWSVAALAAVFQATEQPMIQAGSWWRYGSWNRLGVGPFFPRAVLSSMQSSSLATFSERVGWAFAAGWVATKLSGRPIDPAPDGRERSGRAFLAAIVAWLVVYHAIPFFS